MFSLDARLIFSVFFPLLLNSAAVILQPPPRMAHGAAAETGLLIRKNQVKCRQET